MIGESLTRNSICSSLTRGVGLVAAALLGAAGLASSAQAQCSGYIFTPTTGSIVPGTTDTGNHVDDGGTAITLPFAFNFYGTNYTTINVTSNGYITFNGTDSQSVYNENTYCLPYATFTGPIMAPAWTDGYTVNAGFGIFTGVTGSAPNRVFNIEFRNQYYPGSGTQNYEVNLYEGQTRFDFVYGTATNGYNSTIGVQNGATFTQAQCTLPAPAAGTVLRFDCPSSLPPSCSLSASPGSGSVGSSFSAFATVTPGIGPVSTGLTASLDASGVNGGTVTLHDDGIAPDLVAGDNIFSGTVTVGAGTGLGSHTLTSTVHDLQSRSSTCTTNFNVNPAGCVGEEEPCGVNNPDTFNGGCNSTPFVYGTALLGQAYCGSCANSTAARDTDWYMFTMPANADTIVVSGSAQFLAQSFILAPTCPAVIISPAKLNSAANPDMSYTYGPLTPGGSYVFFMSPQGFDGSAQCGVNDGYNFVLTATSTGACCTGGNCQVTTGINCATLGGTFNGMGTNCGGGNYTFSNTSTAFHEISGTGTNITGSVSNCDDGGLTVALPFSFTFFGAAQNSVWMCTNGFMEFGGNTDTNYLNDAPPSTATPNNAIYPCWDDLYLCTSGAMYYQADGVAPNRTFTVEWSNAPQFTTGPAETFECILYEGSNNIEFRYGNMPADAGGEGGPGGSDYTIGVENSDGTSAYTIPGSDIGTGNTGRMLTFVTTASPCGPTCGSADFNCDGDTGTDADIESFFACLAGNCPAAPCTSSADFNGDGDVGTDADIEAFFRVLAGGHC